MLTEDQHYNKIFMVHLDTGLVKRTWDLSEVKAAADAYAERQKKPKNTNFLSIALDKYTNTFFITGVGWNLVYQVRLDYEQAMAPEKA